MSGGSVAKISHNTLPPGWNTAKKSRIFPRYKYLNNWPLRYVITWGWVSRWTEQRLRTKKLVQYNKTKIYNFLYYYSNTFPDFRSNSSLTYEVCNNITVIIKILLLNVELLRENLFSVIELFLLSLIKHNKSQCINYWFLSLNFSKPITTCWYLLSVNMFVKSKV